MPLGAILFVVALVIAAVVGWWSANRMFPDL